MGRQNDTLIRPVFTPLKYLCTWADYDTWSIESGSAPHPVCPATSRVATNGGFLGAQSCPPFFMPEPNNYIEPLATY